MAGQQTTSSGSIRVGIFGAPRREKGSRRIAKIARCLAASAAPDIRIELIVQARDSDFERGGLYADIASSGLLDGARDARVCITAIPDQLAPAEFEAAFRSVDALLLPYDIREYGTQGSGLVQDAVSARKVVIHAAGMSMQSLLSHGNAIAATSDMDFADAILRCAATLPSFAPGLEAALAHYRRLLADHPLRRAMGLPPPSGPEAEALWSAAGAATGTA